MKRLECELFKLDPELAREKEKAVEEFKQNLKEFDDIQLSNYNMGLRHLESLIDDGRYRFEHRLTVSNYINFCQHKKFKS